MKKFMVLLAGMIITILTVILTARVPYFPGDILLAQWIQKIVPNVFGWAERLTQLFVYPWYCIVLGIICVITWLLTADLCSALLPLVSFGGLWLLDRLLKSIIFQPRPSPELIYVSKKLSGSGFPSTAAMLSGALFGFLAMLIVTQRAYRTTFSDIILVMSCLILVLVFLARVIVGAHWPSALIVSYIISFMWVALLMQLVAVKQ